MQYGMTLVPAVIGDIARNVKRSVVGRFFSRRSTAEKYPVGSSAWLAYTAAKLRNPVVKDIADIQPWMYYDRLTAAAGASPATSLLFFTSPLSSTKTKLDTNLKQAGRLPDPKHFLVMALRFIFTDMHIPDIELMINSYFIEFEIGDKIYAEGHFDLYPGGAGIYGAVSTTETTSTMAVGNNGYPNPFATNNWGKDHGIHILQGQTFQVRANAPTAVTLAASAAAVDGWKQTGRGLNVRSVLDGILYREVQ